MLAWTNTYAALSDERFSAFELMLGYMGPGALAEEVQTFVHDATRARDPRGWDNQLDDELIAGISYMKKWKVISRPNLDLSWGIDGSLSNFITHAQSALEIRFGRMPKGFAFVPGPIGRTINYDATIRDATGYWYGSVVLRATRFLHALPREGNFFTDDNPWTELNQVRMEKSVGQLLVGMHFERPGWALHFGLWFSTDTLERSTLAALEDPDNSFGTIAVEWRR